ncbi:MAG: 16S rRNA (adenine(1518)-N(6)/adenine(1519)-N(6))-dimethyltransferase RsmA [Gammaproteobacteria bacterium]|nr:16S rRNA (adenine(1518)-N(6)/adenine(1519)-N(6))-dimethyltransferase RsmA [Gammaproteobacteria bacterium]MCW8982736.1 16S rRNA (adenine(1518)-N(6)/adenine(1519)-N(6))-dimethyltransferase RsmA [Gammaproteobacteria bacterium]
MAAPVTHRPRKRFGQNFLHDQGVLQKIDHAIRPKPTDQIVEIGPGLGALTQYLIEGAGQINAVELDRDLIEPLTARFGDQLKLHNTDALKFDFCSLAGDGEKLRIIGNLPYNISTPILFRLFEQRACIEDMHFMLQQEVVERIAAAPGNKSYGRLSIMAQYYCKAENLFHVSPEAFNPPPKVHSAIIRLTPHLHPSVEVKDLKQFEDVVRQAFSQRRKTLRNTLKKLISAEQLIELGIDPTQRPEQITIEQYAQISNQISNQI